MASNLADAFGRRGARQGAAPATTPQKGPTPPTTPARQPKENLVAAGVWLPGSLHEQLNNYCRTERLSQAEVILRAVDAAADQIDELAGRPKPQRVVEYTGGLFPRPQPAAEKDPGRSVSIRFRADHLTTLSRLAADHGLKRSVLIQLSLIHYFDHIGEPQ